MSLAYPAIQPVKVLDPKLNFYENKKYVALKGGSQNTYQRFPANNVSSSSAQFTVNPPNSQTAVNRHVLVRYYVDIQFTGTSQSGNLLQLGTNDGFRALPISTSISTATIQINNSSVVQNISDYLQAVLRYNDNIFTRSEDLSLAPSMLDQYQNLSDWTTLGSARNPLADYGENSIETTRGAFPILVLSNTPTSAQIRAVITEPLFVSPFLYTNAQEQALLGVNTMTLNLNFNSNLAGPLTRAWSHSSAGNTLNSATLSFYNAPEVLMNFISLDEVASIPNVLEYPYFDVIRYPNPPQALAPGQSTTVISQNIQCDGIPEAVYIFARQQNNDQNALSSDVFANISNLQITFANVSQIFASATEQDLYNMSLKNGLNGVSYPSWAQFVGSVIKVCPAVDFPLPSDLTSGVGGSYNLLVQATINNINTTQTLNMVLYVVIVREGVISIINGQTINTVNDLSRMDVLNAPTDHNVNYEQAVAVAKQGGRMKTLRHVLGKMTGHGEGMRHHAGVLIGGEGMQHHAGEGMRHHKRKHRRGGGIMSRSDLKKNIVDFDNFSESD